MANRRNPLSEFFTGVALLGSGFKVWVTAPRLMLLGLIPAFIVGAAYLALGITLLVNLERLAGAITPFADGWDPTWATIVRIVVMVALIAVFLVFWVLTYTAVTLTVGSWFYERIWDSVEHQLGNPPTRPEEGFWRGFWRSLGELVRILLPTVLFGVLVFAVGFVPLLGSVLAFTLAAFVGGWFLAVETAGFAFDGRGIRLRERRRALRTRRALTLGFGVASYLVFLIPAGAALAMPAAVAGATILARKVLDESADAIRS